MAAKIAKKVVPEDNSGVSLQFTDGENLTVNLADLSPEMVTQLALHGLSQKLGDSYSGEKDVEVARAKANAVAERLAKGEWKATRDGSGSGRITDLAHAIVRVTGRTLEEVVSMLEEKTKEEKAAIRKNKAVKKALLEIQLERAESSEDDTPLDL